MLGQWGFIQCSFWQRLGTRDPNNVMLGYLRRYAFEVLVGPCENISKLVNEVAVLHHFGRGKLRFHFDYLGFISFDLHIHLLPIIICNVYGFFRSMVPIFRYRWIDRQVAPYLEVCEGFVEV